MPTGIGYGAIMGAKKETTFRTALAMDTRIPFLSESLSDAIKFIEQETLSGNPGRDILDNGSVSISGSVDTEVRYPTANVGRTIFFGNDLLIALAMGSVTWHAGSSTNILKLADDQDKFATLALHKRLNVWEFVSTYLKGFKITGKAGDIWKTSFDALAYKLVKGDPSSGSQINKQAQFDALTVTAAKRCLFGDTTFHLAALNTAWSDANHKIGLSEFTLSYESGLTDPEFATPDSDAGHTDSSLTIQPVRGGFRKVELEFTVPRYQDLSGPAYHWGSQLAAWRDAGTVLQMKATVQPSGDATRKFLMQFPYLILTSLDAAVGGAGPVTMKVKATTLRAAGRNTVVTNAAGSTISEEMEIEFLNSNNSSAEYGRNAAIF